MIKLKNIFKCINSLFIFVFFFSLVSAEILVTDFGCDADNPGVLGINDSITFYIKLNEPIEDLEVFPKEYNSKKISWVSKESGIVYYATYVVEEGDKSQKEPLQLGIITLKNNDEELTLDSGEIVYKSIDAKKPKIKDVILPNIISANKDNYPISFLLDGVEADGLLTYSFSNKGNNITETIELNELYAIADVSLDSQTDISLSFYVDLSSFSDGLVNFKLKILDVANNAADFELGIHKDTVLPEVNEIDAFYIARNNFKAYSLSLKINKPCKSAQFSFSDEKNTFVFERPIENKNIDLSNIDLSFSDFDLSKLRDGAIKLNIVLTDLYNNQSKLYEFELYKDTISPKLTIDQEPNIFHNKDNIVLTGLILDNLHENLFVKYKIMSDSDSLEDSDVFYDCSVKYSPSIENAYNYVTCDINNLSEGKNNILLKTFDRVGNEAENTGVINVSTLPVDFNFHFGERFVTNTAPNLIKGDLILNPEATIETFVAGLKMVDQNQNTGYNMYSPIISSGSFIVNLEKPTAGYNFPVPLKEGEYLLTLYLKDNYGNTVRKTQEIIVDSTAPIIVINNLSTTNRTPRIIGTITDATKTDVLITINSIEYEVVVDETNWSVDLIDALPLGANIVTASAKDEANNSSEIENTIFINSSGGGGRRLTPANTDLTIQDTEENIGEESETTAVDVQESGFSPAEDSSEPGALDTSSVQNELSDTEEVVNTTDTPTSGLTGFVGFANKPGGIITIVLSIFSVVGVLGYLFVFKKR